MLGYDISYYQKGIDIAKSKKYGYSFVMIRTGDGEKKDPECRHFIDQALACDMPFGVYHYSRAKTEEEAIKEAELVFDMVYGKKVSMPITLDMEVNRNREMNTRIFERFCREIRGKFGETTQMMLYTSENFFNNYFHKGRVADIAHLWIAKYSDNPPVTGQDIFMWQYSSSKSNGFYTKPLDRDILLQPYSVFNEK